MYTYISKSEDQTKSIAKYLAKQLQKGDVITLEGDLGTGKTSFTKGIALGLDVTRHVTSPTFTIMKQYKDGTLPLYHIDAYRLESESEDIGFEEYIGSDGIVVIEWAQFIEEFLPKEKLEIKIKMIDENKREIKFQPYGIHYEKIIKHMKMNFS